LIQSFDTSRDLRAIKKVSAFWLDHTKKLEKRKKNETGAGADGAELQGIAISGPSSSAQHHPQQDSPGTFM